MKKVDIQAMPAVITKDLLKRIAILEKDVMALKISILSKQPAKGKRIIKPTLILFSGGLLTAPKSAQTPQIFSKGARKVRIPRVEFEALLEKLEDLKDLRDSIEALCEYQSGNYISFDRYHARRKVKRTCSSSTGHSPTMNHKP